jgi:hypothetical protein
LLTWSDGQERIPHITARLDASGDVRGHTLGVEVDQRPGWRSRAIVDEVAGARYRTMVILPLRAGGDLSPIREIGPQNAKRDRLISTAGHDVLGEFRSRFSRSARCSALSHQALRAVTAYLPLFVEEDAFRHDRIWAALLYQRDLRLHCWTFPFLEAVTFVVSWHERVTRRRLPNDESCFGVPGVVVTASIIERHAERANQGEL